MALTADGLLLAQEYPELQEAVTALLKDEGIVDSAGEGLLRLQTAGSTVLCLSGGTFVTKSLRYPESGLHVVKDLRQAVTAPYGDAYQPHVPYDEIAGTGVGRHLGSQDTGGHARRRGDDARAHRLQYVQRASLA